MMLVAPEEFGASQLATLPEAPTQILRSRLLTLRPLFLTAARLSLFLVSRLRESKACAGLCVRAGRERDDFVKGKKGNGRAT